MIALLNKTISRVTICFLIAGSDKSRISIDGLILDEIIA
jgi:hypothetical protein